MTWSTPPDPQDSRNHFLTMLSPVQVPCLVHSCSQKESYFLPLPASSSGTWSRTETQCRSIFMLSSDTVGFGTHLGGGATRFSWWGVIGLGTQLGFGASGSSSSSLLSISETFETLYFGGYANVDPVVGYPVPNRKRCVRPHLSLCQKSWHLGVFGRSQQRSVFIPTLPARVCCRLNFTHCCIRWMRLSLQPTTIVGFHILLRLSP